MIVLFRADGSASIGAGHIMRCLSLVQAAHDAGHNTVFLMEPGAESLKERLQNEGCDVHELKSMRGSNEDALETATLARECGAMCAVVDGYVFDAPYQQTLHNEGVCFLLIDDYGQADTYYASIILNQNSYAQKLESIYRKRSSQSELLLGSEYVLLRREYREAAQRQNTPEIANEILVTFGGGDTQVMTQRIIEVLKGIDESTLNITVLIGGSNPHADKIESTAQGMHVIRDAQNMPELLANTELAIAAGGTTSYELAYMGVPSLLFILAENQRLIAEDLNTRGIVKSIGKPDQVSDITIVNAIRELITNVGQRRSMAQIGQQLIDGQGAMRVLERLTSISQ